MKSAFGFDVVCPAAGSFVFPGGKRGAGLATNTGIAHFFQWMFGELNPQIDLGQCLCGYVRHGGKFKHIQPFLKVQNFYFAPVQSLIPTDSGNP